MRLLDRILGCVGCAALAWFFGTALNVPVWRGWNLPGDRADIAATAFFAAWLLSKNHRPTPLDPAPKEEQ